MRIQTSLHVQNQLLSVAEEFFCALLLPPISLDDAEVHALRHTHTHTHTQAQDLFCDTFTLFFFMLLAWSSHFLPLLRVPVFRLPFCKKKKNVIFLICFAFFLRCFYFKLEKPTSAAHCTPYTLMHTLTHTHTHTHTEKSAVKENNEVSVFFLLCYFVCVERG